MANDNQAGGRTFLAIVLGGIVLALVIAAYFMYGHKAERPAKVEPPAAEAPAPPRRQPRRQRLHLRRHPWRLHQRLAPEPMTAPRHRPQQRRPQRPQRQRHRRPTRRRRPILRQAASGRSILRGSRTAPTPAPDGSRRARLHLSRARRAIRELQGPLHHHADGAAFDHRRAARSVVERGTLNQPRSRKRRAKKRRAPARGLPRLVRITQNALPPRQDTTGRVENASRLWQFFDVFLSISLLTTRICAVSPHPAWLSLPP